MRKLVLASAVAFAALVGTAHMASNVALMRAAHADEAVAPTWLVTVVITNPAGERIYDLLYFRQADPERRFASEDACKAFLNQDPPDAVLATANDGLRVEVARVLGPDAKVEIVCTVEPTPQ